MEAFKPRLYQEKILNTAVKGNTLVVLPTGLGKTAIAAMLSKHRLKNYPESKILLLAPTKPLAQQHEKTLNKFFENEKIALFTGTVSPEKRKALWVESNIIISTPQGLENDVISRKISLENVSLLIFDEAHRATGDYAYTYIAKKYEETSKHTRILALTASPGADNEKILEVCENLFIEHIEYRNNEDEDVKPYVQDMNMEYIKVELPEELKKIKSFLERCYNSKLAEASNYGYVQGLANVNKTTLLAMVSSLHAKIAQGEKEFEVLKTISLLAEALKVQHAIELIETQGVYPLLEYMQQLETQARTSATKAVKNLVRDLNFRSALIAARAANEKGINHPKYETLKQVIHNQVTEKQNSKIIIFTQFRDSATKIKEILKEEKISSELFVGQAKKKNVGMSQKKQKEIIEKFEKEEFSCLLATSVGEEGLDIPEVDLVIFYEPIPSAIRTVQRRGRTGRQKEGRVITLITKNTRDESYRWVAHHKEKKMYRVLDEIKNKLRIPRKKEEKQLKDYDETNKIVIRADYREKGSPVMKELLDMNVELELSNIEIGDYHLSEHVVVEYKTVKDFVDSIIDGRLLSQARELKQYYQPIIIIEGEQDIYAQRRIHPNAIRGMLAALTINLRIPVLRTNSAKDTAAMIKIIAEREQKKDDKDHQMHTLKPQTDEEIMEYVVAAFPGIGAKLSPYLLKHFKTIKNIVNAEEKDLKEVELIGPGKAKRLKELIDKEYSK